MKKSLNATGQSRTFGLQFIKPALQTTEPQKFRLATARSPFVPGQDLDDLNGFSFSKD